MYDIKPLEEEWEKYRKKKRKPFYLFVLTLLLLGAGTGFLYYMKEKGLIKLDMNVTQKTASKPVTYMENKPLSSLEVEKAPQTLTVKPQETSDEIVEDLPIASDARARKKPRVKMNIVTTEMPTAKRVVREDDKPHERVPLSITKVSGANAYKEVAKRFRETQDTDDSLFLAKAYYNEGKYKKAEYWALQTNNVDSNIEESILIFAKAKAKRGRKHEAIRILTKYIKQTDSSEAKALLQKVKKGKI